MQNIGETTYDFAFDLNEFFSVEEGKTTFKHEKHVKKWLERLTKNEKYPFSTFALPKGTEAHVLAPRQSCQR